MDDIRGVFIVKEVRLSAWDGGVKCEAWLFDVEPDGSLGPTVYLGLMSEFAALELAKRVNKQVQLNVAAYEPESLPEPSA